MKKTITALALAAVLGLPHGPATADEHHELDAADEAFSAENYPQAAALYRKDAELGVISAQVNLALMYLDGLGLRQDFAQAAAWFLKAAQQGNAEAQYNLGLLYQDGKGVERSAVEADKWFIVADAKANAQAVEKDLTPAQRSEAKKLAEEWSEGFRKKKGR